MIFGRHNDVLAPVLPIPAYKRENALLFGKGCGNLVPVQRPAKASCRVPWSTLSNV